MPKLSIITINYNDANGLEKTIQSVVEQDFEDFEYIVIDGGSSDESKSIIEKYQSQITYWVSEKDKGIYNAMNKGIAQAKGDYCLFLNSGDYLAKLDVLTTMLTKENNSDIIYGNMIIDWGEGKLEYGKMPSKITFNQMYIDTLWHPVSLIKRNLFERYGTYNETYKMVADYDFFFKVIIMKNVSLQYMDMNVSVYNMKGLSSLLENKTLEESERKQVLLSYLPQSVIDFAEQQAQRKKISFLTRLLKKII
jgi:glycosyltransferase involved in cell wall biosynthesis